MTKKKTEEKNPNVCAVCLLSERVQSRITALRASGMYPTEILVRLGSEGNGLSIRNLEYHTKNHIDIESSREVLVQVAELIADSGIDMGDIGKVDKIRANAWQALTKDADGEAQIHDLKGGAIVLSPKWETGPKWDPVAPAKPVRVTVPRMKARAKVDTGFKTAVILPDTQFGFLRDIQNPSKMTAMHSEPAIDVALQIMQYLKPDLAVNLGDFCDFASFGRFMIEPTFALTTQAAIDRGHSFLAQQRAIMGDGGEIRLLEGNHDVRLSNSIKTNLVAAFGLQKANLPDSWPVMSLPSLLRLDELEVEYIGAYPAGESWINDRLVCIHGRVVRSNGSTAKAVVDQERVSLLHGHTHRMEMAYMTRRVRGDHRVNLAASPGALCRVDGVVPSTKGGTDPFGNPVQSFENWQNGIGVVTYQEGDGPFAYESVLIHKGEAIFRGHQFKATVDFDGNPVEVL